MLKVIECIVFEHKKINILRVFYSFWNFYYSTVIKELKSTQLKKKTFKFGKIFLTKRIRKVFLKGLRKFLNSHKSFETVLYDLAHKFMGTRRVINQ